MTASTPSLLGQVTTASYTSEHCTPRTAWCFS